MITKFNRHERMLCLLHSPGTRLGLIAELEKMQGELSAGECNLKKWTASTTQKLKMITDRQFDELMELPDNIEQE